MKSERLHRVLAPVMVVAWGLAFVGVVATWFNRSFALVYLMAVVATFAMLLTVLDAWLFKSSVPRGTPVLVVRFRNGRASVGSRLAMDGGPGEVCNTDNRDSSFLKRVGCMVLEQGEIGAVLVEMEGDHDGLVSLRLLAKGVPLKPVDGQVVGIGPYRDPKAVSGVAFDVPESKNAKSGDDDVFV